MRRVVVQEIERASAVVIQHRGRIAAAGSPPDLMARSGAASLEGAFLALAAVAPDPVA